MAAAHGQQGWTCHRCTFFNRRRGAATEDSQCCHACGSARYGSTRRMPGRGRTSPSSRSPPPVAPAQTTSLGDATSQHQQPKRRHPKSGHHHSRAKDKTRRQRHWTCPRCSLHNPVHNTHCAACYYDVTVAVPLRAQSGRKEE